MLDHQLVQALEFDGRASFSALAEVLGVSAHTVARRFRRLRAGGLRVLGRIDDAWTGNAKWQVRLRCAPAAAVPVANALARRPDTSFVGLFSGGTEICCVTEPALAGTASPEALLLERLPRTPRVESVTAHCFLHTYFGGPDGWYGKAGRLADQQIAMLRTVPAAPPRTRPHLDEDDLRLVAALAEDGRAGHAVLHRATGLSESSVRRRIERLRATAGLFFDTQFDPGLLGFRTIAVLWLTVHPGALAAVGAALAGHPEVAFAAAVTGPSNLTASIICRSNAHLYEYLTGSIAPLDGIVQVESAPVLRQVKQLAYDPLTSLRS